MKFIIIFITTMVLRVLVESSGLVSGELLTTIGTYVFVLGVLGMLVSFSYLAHRVGSFKTAFVLVKMRY